MKKRTTRGDLPEPDPVAEMRFPPAEITDALPAAADLPPDETPRRRLLLVLPVPTIKIIQDIASCVNGTYSSVVHMAMLREFWENQHLRYQRDIEQFFKTQQSREGG